MLFFNRFAIHSAWSGNGLWFVVCKDSYRQHHRLSFSIIDCTFEEGTYYALQIILYRWVLIVGDRKTFKPS